MALTRGIEFDPVGFSSFLSGLSDQQVTEAHVLLDAEIERRKLFISDSTYLETALSLGLEEEYAVDSYDELFAPLGFDSSFTFENE